MLCSDEYGDAWIDDAISNCGSVLVIILASSSPSILLVLYFYILQTCVSRAHALGENARFLHFGPSFFAFRSAASGGRRLDDDKAPANRDTAKGAGPRTHIA